MFQTSGSLEKCHAKQKKPDTKDLTFSWFHTGEDWNEKIYWSRKEISDCITAENGWALEKGLLNIIEITPESTVTMAVGFLIYRTLQIFYIISVNCMTVLTDVNDTFITFKANTLI